jgi:glutamate dehydrogenase (NAD(P)+)
VDCDILIPAALEQQITATNAAHQRRARVMVIRRQRAPAATIFLKERNAGGADVIANAGGVTVKASLSG